MIKPEISMDLTQHLQAYGLEKDPRIATAKQLILEAIAEKQNHVTAIRPNNSKLTQSYQDIIKQFNEYRGNSLWFPYIGSGLGNGPLVELFDGSIKFDAICGIGVHFFGHNHPALTEACIDAALSDIPLQGNLQQNIDSVELSKILTEASNLPHCFLSSSGAMAVENALKIAFQKNFPAQRLLAFEHCFAGRTIVLSQITDKPSFREGLPHTVEVDYIPYYDQEKPEESLSHALEMLKKYIARYPKDHAAMIFELVQGEGGFYHGTREFFTPLMKLCRDNQIAVIVDEIQSFGRTHELFAFHHFDLEEYVDICTIGKLSQVCATLFKDDFKPRAGLLSQTFTSSTSAIRCSIAILKMLIQSDLYGKQGKNSRFHSLFVNAFKNIAQRHPGSIRGPFGIGAMIAFTLLDGNSAQTQKFVHSLFDAGLICFVAGGNPTRVRMLPPIPILTEDDVETVASIIESCL